MIAHVLMTLPAMVTGMWTVILLLDRLRRRERTPGALLLFMATAMVLYVCHSVFFARYTPLAVPADVVYTYCNLAVYPLFLIYIGRLTGSSAHRCREWFLLSPAAVIAAMVGVLYGTMDGDATAAFINDYLYRGGSHTLHGPALAQAVVHKVAHVVFAAEVIAVAVLGVRQVAAYHRKVAAYYADVDDKSLRPLHHLLVAMVITCIVSLVANAIGRHVFAGSTWMLAIPSLAFSSLLFAIGYVGQSVQYNITRVDDEVLNIEEEAEEAVATDEERPEAGDLERRLAALMDDEKLFLQPNLRITDVAARLGTNRNYVYLLLRHVLNTTFTDFINDRRVAHAQALMERNPTMLLTEVATMSGFASATSFYRHFKRVTGLSPKDFQSRV